MRCVALISIALQTIICGAHVHPSAYNPVFEYDVPVASQPIIYAEPSYAVSHTYSQTQTHPVSYVKPVNALRVSSGQYYAPASATSRVEVVPQTNRIYRYQSTNQQYNYPQQNEGLYGNQRPSVKMNGEGRQDQQYSGQYNRQNQYNSQNQYNNQNQYNSQNQYRENGQSQNSRNFYANRNPYTNNGEQVKLRRYQIHRPGIKKEFYDIEERVIVRPAGSALIELDPPSEKQDITNNHSDKNFENNNGYNSHAYEPNNQYDSSKSHYQNGQYFSTGVPDCGGYFEQYDYSPPATFGSTDTQYHPTTFAPPTTTSSPYPTTPSQTYLPPFSTDSSISTQSTYTPEYTPSTTTYSPTPVQYTPTKTTPTSSSSTQKQTDVFISSTTPVSVVIVDKNNNANQNRTEFQGQDVIYANQGQSNENSPDQFQNELPPRGDISQYRSEDQFYHELPRSRYSNDPNRPPQTFNVYSRSNGEPTEGPYYKGEEAEIVEINGRNFSQINQNQTSTGNDQQARLIKLYTDGDGISEVGQSEDRTNVNGQYVADSGNRYNTNDRNDVGRVRARVVSVTPPPAAALPTETVNRRRIVVSKPVTTIQEVVESDNSTANAQRASYSEGQNQRNFSDYNENYRNENIYNQNYNSNYRSGSNTNQGFGDNYDQKLNDGSQAKKSNYEKSPRSSDVYISATPTTASERIIYVQPVSQDFAQQKAVDPKNH